VIEETRGRASAAEASYRRELELQPGNFMASYNLAELLRRGGRPDEALAFYRATIRSNPSFSIPYFMAAKHYFDRRQNLAEAVALCRAGIALPPQDKYTAFGYYILSDIYGLQGDRAQAASCYRRAQALLASLAGAAPGS
jgi:tetratricopeptide (TPR) repeat protein